MKEASAPASLGRGAQQVKKVLAGPGQMEADLNLIVFESARYDVRVVRQTSRENAVSLTSVMSELGAVAGCNGGYFTPEFLPLGLEVSDGVRTGDVLRSGLLGGMVGVRGGKPVLLWRDEYRPQGGYTQLIQAGPRLVDKRMPIAGLEATRRRARTFVISDLAGRWALGTCRSVTLRELSELLITPGVVTELKVERALNLDGGSSSGLWWREEGGQAHVEREFARVRNFLAVVPKKKGA